MLSVSDLRTDNPTSMAHTMDVLPVDLFAHPLGLEVADLLRHVDADVHRLVVTVRLSRYKPHRNAIDICSYLNLFMPTKFLIDGVSL